MNSIDFGDWMRHLASIQRIDSLEPIAGADQIEKARILGWELVVKKGEFAVGDTCIYCETDSVLPDKSPFEFLRPRKFRIKIMRLRGQISQGIAFPISLLPNSETGYQIGQDVTELMGVTKWEPIIPAHLSGVIKGNFPSFLVKTDEPRIQILQGVLDHYAGTVCYVSEKVDGTSTTISLKDGVLGICSRNLELVESQENSFWQIAREQKLEEKMKAYCEAHKMNIAIQGELIGNGVQKNPLQISGKKILFFNVFDIDRHTYLDYLDFRSACAEMNLETVPIVDENFILTNDIPSLVQYATAKSALNPNVWREGVIIRPMKEIVDTTARGLENGRLSFKIVNPEYILKYDA